MDDQPTAFLRIPLYKLLYLKEIPDEPLTPDELKEWTVGYEPDEVQQIIAAIRWGCSHPEYDFSPLLPGSRFSNQDAHRYLVNLLRQIETMPL